MSTRPFPVEPGTIEDLLINLGLQGQKVRKIEINAFTKEIKVEIHLQNPDGTPVYVTSEHTALPVGVTAELYYVEELPNREDD